MQLALTTYIAGQKTVGDWLAIRPSLNNFNDNATWETAFSGYFLTRLNDRYFRPINSIKQDGSYSGEGFSMMAIVCSLIEFLETTYQGTNYRYRRNGDPPLGPFEYSASSLIFVSFLTTKQPFSTQFDTATAAEFYSNIRCGLLHEARTNGNWTIWGKSSKNDLIEKTGTETIIFRDDFFNAVDNYVKVDYKAQLLSSVDRKQAFLRKYDRLCQE